MAEGPEQMPMMTLLSALRPHWGKQIRRYELPLPQEMREVPEDFQGPPLVREGLRLIAEYLALPIIEDYFKTEAERTAWRLEIEEREIEKGKPDTFAAYENNKLRISKVSYALQGLENILPTIEWTKLAGYGNLPAAHKEGLFQTIKLWKKAEPPETLHKLQFIEETLVPLLQHAFDSTLAATYPPPTEDAPKNE